MFRDDRSVDSARDPNIAITYCYIKRWKGHYVNQKDLSVSWKNSCFAFQTWRSGISVLPLRSIASQYLRHNNIYKKMDRDRTCRENWTHGPNAAALAFVGIHLQICIAERITMPQSPCQDTYVIYLTQQGKLKVSSTPPRKPLSAWKWNSRVRVPHALVLTAQSAAHSLICSSLGCYLM